MAKTGFVGTLSAHPEPDAALKFSRPLGRPIRFHLLVLLLHELVRERLLPLDLLHLREGQPFGHGMHRLLRNRLGELPGHLLLSLFLTELGVLDDVRYGQARPSGWR